MSFWYHFDQKGIGCVSLNEIIVNIRSIFQSTTGKNSFFIDDSKFQLEHRVWDWFAIIERSLFILADYRYCDLGLEHLTFYKNDVGQQFLRELGVNDSKEQSQHVISYIKQQKKNIKESIENVRYGFYKDYAVKANLLLRNNMRPSNDADRLFVQTSQDSDIVNINMEYMVRHKSYQQCIVKSNKLASLCLHPGSFFEAVKIIADEWCNLKDSYEISTFINKHINGKLQPELLSISNTTDLQCSKDSLFPSARSIAKMLKKRKLHEFTAEQIALTQNNNDDICNQDLCKTTQSELMLYDPSFHIVTTTAEWNKIVKSNLIKINAKLAESTTPLTTVSYVEATPSHNGMSLFYGIVVAQRISETIRDVFANESVTSSSAAFAVAQIAEHAVSNLPYEPREFYNSSIKLRKTVIEFMKQNEHNKLFVDFAAHLFNTTMEQQILNVSGYPDTEYECVPLIVKIIACMLEMDIKLYTVDCVFVCIADKLVFRTLSAENQAKWHQPLKATIAFDGKNFHSVGLLPPPPPPKDLLPSPNGTHPVTFKHGGSWNKFIRV